MLLYAVRVASFIAVLAALFAVVQPPISLFVWDEAGVLPLDAWPAVGFGQVQPLDPVDVGAVGHLVNVSLGPRGCIVIVQPVQARLTLGEFCTLHANWIDDQLLLHGGILFRGWNVSSVYEFDELVPLIIPGVAPELYVGTSPRTRLADTRFVSTASEIPAPLMIPEHLEMSFKPHPPRRIAFYAAQPNTSPGGQTPVVDFRAVWRALPGDVRARFRERGIRYERWYYDKNSGTWDPMMCKAWQDMFSTTNRMAAAATALAQGFDTTWDPDTGAMGLSNVAAAAYRVHSRTGDEYWGNHLHVLHGPSFPVPYAWSAQLQGSPATLARYYVYALWVWVHESLGWRLGHDVTHADGGAIAAADVQAVRLTISKLAFVYSHAANDIVLLDNERVAHGRQPWYGGPRRVYVAWH